MDQVVNKRSEQVFSNARIVLADEVVTGKVQVVDGLIKDISQAPVASDTPVGVALHPAEVVDCGGDYLLPGLIELHTDHLETHYSPRPGVRWAKMTAIQAHDAQIAAAGITTVYDCLRMGREEDDLFEAGEMVALAEGLRLAAEQQRLRVEHRLHLRCEVSASDVLDDFDEFASNPNVGLVSLMDHAPGQRQFTSLEAYARYHKTKKKMTDEAFAQYVTKRVDASDKYSALHRKMLAQMCAERAIPLASHDDATLAHVDESIEFGVKLAEFPTTLDAAHASHAAGLGVLMGAPNVVRGQSHTGNVAARTLIDNQCLDILSSDYIPASLLQAVFLIFHEEQLLALPDAVALASRNPARFMELQDRGEIATGLRADLVRVAHYPEQDSAPLVKAVWRDGQRVL